MKTQVIISIDTEFSIAGAFADPQHNKPVGLPNVYCQVKGQSQGLGFILQTLKQYQLQACFFVEALNCYYFGDEPMASVAHQLLQAGHEVQLHLHPVWHQFQDTNWQHNLLRNPPNDDFCKRSLQQTQAIMADGLEIFKRWGIPRPLALRTGGLCVNKNIYRAMAVLGLPMASNIGLSIFRPTEPELHLYGGAQRIDTVWEFPIMTYRQSLYGLRSREKTVTVTGSAWQEIQYLLRTARAQALPIVVILTHPFEFVKAHDNQFNGMRRNRINQNRFVRLCQFLAKHKDHFYVGGFSSLNLKRISAMQQRFDPPQPPAWTGVKQLGENTLNAISWI